MQNKDKFFDDLAKLFQNAVGVAQDAGQEAENLFRGFVERQLADMNLVDREEVEAVRDMAIKAREENEALAARVAELERVVVADTTSDEGNAEEIEPAGDPEGGEAESSEE